MSFMAYDIGRVRLLRTAMTAALDELRAICCDDSSADQAMHTVRVARATLADAWLPLLGRIVDCVAMSDYRSVSLDVGDLRQSVPLMMATGFGWQVMSDPLANESARLTATDSRALAWRLNTGDLRRLTDKPDELRWLARQLTAIAADPDLTAAFVGEFLRWAELCDELGERRVELLHHEFTFPSDSTAEAVHLLDEVFSGLGAVWSEHRRARSAQPCVDPIPAAAAMQPYSVAALARYVALAADDRAGLSAEVLTRWTWGDPGDELSVFGWWDRSRHGPNTADLLFDTLLRDPAACVRFLALAVGDPLTLFATADDETLAHRVVLAGTDPHHCSPGDAGRVILPLLRFFQRGGYWGVAAVFDAHDPAWQPFLGELVAPWLLQFSPLDDDWDAEPEERRDLLASVLRDPIAFDHLAGADSAALDGLTASLRRTGRDGITLEQTAAFIGMLGQLDLNELVADEQRRLDAWNLWWGLAALPIGRLPRLPAAAAGFVVDRLHDGAAEHGWLSVPSPADVQNRAGYQQQWMLTVAGATVARLAVAGMIQRGALPVGTTMPPDPDPDSLHPQLQYERDYLAWKASTFAGPNDPMAAEVDAWKSPFLSAAHAGEELAESVTMKE